MFNKIKEEINIYKMYRENKDEIRDYLFETSFGSECESCLEFTTLFEKRQFEGVCKDCFNSGKQTCSRCGNTVFTPQMDVDGVCEYCKYDDDFDPYYDSGNSPKDRFSNYR